MLGEEDLMTVDNRFNPDELKQLLQNKYGTGVRVQVFPNAQGEETDEVEGEELHTTQKFDFEHKPSGIKEYLDRYVYDRLWFGCGRSVFGHAHLLDQCHKENHRRDRPIFGEIGKPSDFSRKKRRIRRRTISRRMSIAARCGGI